MIAEEERTLAALQSWNRAFVEGRRRGRAMQMNQAGYDLIKKFEQCRLVAYDDGTGRWTIGWGHARGDVHEGETWSQQQADDTLVQDVSDTVDDLLDMIQPDLTDNQFSALVSMAYNIGSHAFEGSSALLLINENRLSEVPLAMMKWCKARIGGVLHISRGLLHRRQAEVQLWSAV